MAAISLTVGEKRLLKLAALLRKVPPKAFKFTSVVEFIGPNAKTDPFEVLEAGGKCGTVACAVGWMPAAFPKACKWLPSRNGSDQGAVVERSDERVHGSWDFNSLPWIESKDFACDFFRISPHEASALFIPHAQGRWGLPNLSDAATPKQVAANIQRFVAQRRKERGAKPLKAVL